MRVWAVSLMLGCPAALAGGWFTAILPPDASVAAVRATPTPQVDHAGLQSALAKKAFVSLGMPTVLAPPMEMAAATTAPIAAPTPIDQQLARDLTAVIGSGKTRRIMVIDRDAGDARREIKVGEEFRDGWKVSAIRNQEIVLKQADQEMVVSLFGSAPVAPGAPAAQPPT